MTACRSAIERKTRRRRRCRVIFEKKLSTGVEPGDRGRGEMQGRARMARQPDVCGWRSCRGRPGSLVGRSAALDRVEKANEFAMAVALHAASNDRAVEHAARGELRGGAVLLVIMRHRLAAPGLDRQSRLGV